MGTWLVVALFLLIVACATVMAALTVGVLRRLRRSQLATARLAGVTEYQFRTLDALRFEIRDLRRSLREDLDGGNPPRTPEGQQS